MDHVHLLHVRVHSTHTLPTTTFSILRPPPGNQSVNLVLALDQRAATTADGGADCVDDPRLASLHQRLHGLHLTPPRSGVQRAVSLHKRFGHAQGTEDAYAPDR